MLRLPPAPARTAVALALTISLSGALPSTVHAADVPPESPYAMVPPVLSGTPAVGERIWANKLAFQNPTQAGGVSRVTGYWLADGELIKAPANQENGAGSDSNYGPTEAVIGKFITFRLVATRGVEVLSVADSLPVGPVRGPAPLTVLTMPAATTLGEPMRVRVGVTALGPQATGSVRVTVAGVSQTAPVRNNVADLVLPATLAAGAHTLTASYSGDPVYFPSTTTSTAWVRPSDVRVVARTAKVRGRVLRSRIRVLAPSTGMPRAVRATVKGRDFTRTVTVRVTPQGRAVLVLRGLPRGRVRVHLSLPDAPRVTTRFRVRV